MQSNPVMPQENRRRVGLMRLFFGGLLLFIVSSMIVYLAWDYMPARIQYIPRYVQSHFLPAPPRPASVPTPVAVAAPEDTLASLDLAQSSEEVTPKEESGGAEGERSGDEEALSGNAPDEATEQEAESALEEAESAEREAEQETERALEEAESPEREAESALGETESAQEEPESTEGEAESTEGEAESAEQEPESAEQEPESAEREAEPTLEAQVEAAQTDAEVIEKEAEGSLEEDKALFTTAESTEEEAESTEEGAESTEEEAESTEEGAESASEEAQSASEEAIYALPGAKAVLKGIQHEFQGWNNCGPATLGMQLSFFGRTDKQADTAPFLKPSPDDKNVSPDEMVAYAHSIGYGGQVVVGMDLEMLRTFTANGLPVVVESWFIPEPDDEMGHYLLLTAYDGETLNFYDSYNGPDVQEQADEFDELWKVFNRTAIVVWPPEKEELATAILGDLTDSQVMYERALATAHAEVKANPQDKYAWFNLGTNLTVLGDIPNAVKAFDTARSLELPWRMLWYQFEAYEAYFENAQYEEVIALTTTTLESSDNLEESYYWRGRTSAALGQIDAARSDFEEAVRLNANFTPAQSALDELR